MALILSTCGTGGYSWQLILSTTAQLVFEEEYDRHTLVSSWLETKSPRGSRHNDCKVKSWRGIALIGTLELGQVN
jgi:hypothetical protein